MSTETTTDPFDYSKPYRPKSELPPAFDFGPDAPWTVEERDGTFRTYAILQDGQWRDDRSTKESAERLAYERNLLHFGPTLLAELEALRAENARLKAKPKAGTCWAPDDFRDGD